jgi:hypothetical protein
MVKNGGDSKEILGTINKCSVGGMYYNLYFTSIGGVLTD